VKKNELNVLKKKGAVELEKEIAKLLKKKLELEVAISAGKEKNLKSVRNIRRDIAQMLTLQSLTATEGQAIKEKGEKFA